MRKIEHMDRRFRQKQELRYTVQYNTDNYTVIIFDRHEKRTIGVYKEAKHDIIIMREILRTTRRLNQEFSRYNSEIMDYVRS